MRLDRNSDDEILKGFRCGRESKTQSSVKWYGNNQ